MNPIPNRAALALLLLGLPACASLLEPVRPPPPPETPAPEPPPPIGYHFVINNTGQRQVCAFRRAGGAWSRWFVLPPAANWREENLGVPLFFQCRPPVPQRQYELAGGTRYSLLRGRDGSVQLVEVTAGPDR